MKFFILILFSMPVLAETLIENSKCPVPHVPIRWKISYCMAKNETDDVEAVQSSKCMEETIAKRLDVCGENAYWKKQWCDQIIKNHKGKSVADCLKDRKMEPSGVTGGF